MNNDWKQRLGMVYSTNPDYVFETDNEQEQPETLPPGQQKLRLAIERHQRNGKTVTLVRGFVGCEADLKELSKQLKVHCGTGGSVKGDEIVIQGEMKEKIKAFLLRNGYKDVR